MRADILMKTPSTNCKWMKRRPQFQETVRSKTGVGSVVSSSQKCTITIRYSEKDKATIIYYTYRNMRKYMGWEMYINQLDWGSSNQFKQTLVLLINANFKNLFFSKVKNVGNPLSYFSPLNFPIRVELKDNF